jgi:hypothetical protein
MENTMNPRTLLVVLRASAAAMSAVSAVLKTTKKK